MEGEALAPGPHPANARTGQGPDPQPPAGDQTGAWGCRESPSALSHGMRRPPCFPHLLCGPQPCPPGDLGWCLPGERVPVRKRYKPRTARPSCLLQRGRQGSRAPGQDPVAPQELRARPRCLLGTGIFLLLRSQRSPGIGAGPGLALGRRLCPLQGAGGAGEHARGPGQAAARGVMPAETLCHPSPVGMATPGPTGPTDQSGAAASQAGGTMLGLGWVDGGHMPHMGAKGQGYRAPSRPPDGGPCPPPPLTCSSQAASPKGWGRPPAPGAAAR